MAWRPASCEGLGDWLWDYLRYNETLYSRLIDQGKSDPALENAARRDIETLVLLAQTDCDRFIDAMKPLLPNESLLCFKKGSSRSAFPITRTSGPLFCFTIPATPIRGSRVVAPYIPDRSIQPGWTMSAPTGVPQIRRGGLWPPSAGSRGRG